MCFNTAAIDCFIIITSRPYLLPAINFRLYNKGLRVKTAIFANSINPDEVAHNEPPHLDLHCSPSSFLVKLLSETLLM